MHKWLVMTSSITVKDALIIGLNILKVSFSLFESLKFEVVHLAPLGRLRFKSILKTFEVEILKIPWKSESNDPR